MIGFSGISKVVINYSHLKKAFDFLRLAGESGVEGIALFAGEQNGSDFQIKEVIIPKQKGYVLEQGLLYAVDGDELHRIKVWLYNNNLDLIAQIHSHPGVAYHSDTDDRYPIVDTVGGISIVAPNFASNVTALTQCAIYRLSTYASWISLDKNGIKNLFVIN